MLKYRVYDTQEKKYRDDLYFFIAPNGELLWSYELTDGLYPTDPQRFIIEQYTGLKDKNGVEIAEGDILGLYEIYIEEDETESEELEPWGEVVRTAAAMMVRGVRAGTLIHIVDDGEDPSEPMAGVEVIGNIHENSDLLGRV